MKVLRLAALALAGTAVPAFAGPPYLTNDPAPTDPGHWEIYLFSAGEGRGSSVNDATGLELNYGAIKDIQLTATLPFAFNHDRATGWRSGTGDVELGVKYRFYKDERSGFAAAVFPKAILPTSTIADGERTRLLLPLWLGRDFKGGTSLFGGGGYMINPGSGNRDFWQAGIALTQAFGKKFSVGAEVTRQGSDTVDGTAQTRADVGSILRLSGHYGLLFSGGPTWANHQTGYHFYAALGIFY